MPVFAQVFDEREVVSVSTTTDPATVRAMNCAGGEPDDGAVPLPELAVQLCAGAVAISAATAAWLLLVAEFDRREGWAVPGVTSCAQWLSWQCGMAPGTARDHVRTARALPGLPGTTRELSEGRISYAKARAIARVADADTEAGLLEVAANCTAAQLERVVAGWRRSDEATTDAARAQADRARSAARSAAIAAGGDDEDGDAAGRAASAQVWATWWPEGADPDAAPRQWEKRFDWHDEGDGSVTLRIRLSAEDAAEMVAAVENRAEVLTRRERVAAARDRRATPDGEQTPAPWADWAAGHDVPRGGADRRNTTELTRVRRARVTVARTDALLDLLRAGAAVVDTQPGDPAPREVLIRVDAAVLAEDLAAGQAALDGVASLSAAQARRLACDAAITTVLVEDGQVLACGRRRRNASRAQRRALLLRDGGCARPGCAETRPERLHAHHVVPWLLGGRTDVENLVLLCDRCHGLVHDLDLTVERAPDGLRAHRQDGTGVWLLADEDAAPTSRSGEPSGPDEPPHLPPYWRANGERMDLRHVVGTVLGNRAALRRRRRAELQDADGSRAA